MAARSAALPEVPDRIFCDLPIMQRHGQPVDPTVTAIRRDEDFAAGVRERLG